MTTEEFERSLAILAARQEHRPSDGRIHNYSLQGLVYAGDFEGKQKPALWLVSVQVISR